MHHLGTPALAAGDVCDGDVGGAEVVVAGIAQESRERKIALQPPSSARQNVSSYLGSSSCPIPDLCNMMQRQLQGVMMNQTGCASAGIRSHAVSGTKPAAHRDGGVKRDALRRAADAGQGVAGDCHAAQVAAVLQAGTSRCHLSGTHSGSAAAA